MLMFPLYYINMSFKEQIRLCSLKDIFTHIDQWKHQHRYIEFWAFLHADQVMLKTLDETDATIQPRTESWPPEKHFIDSMFAIDATLPKTNPYLQKLLGVFVKPTRYVDCSSRIFPWQHRGFNEMEYQVPVEFGLQCLDEILYVLCKHQVPMFFPSSFVMSKAMRSG